MDCIFCKIINEDIPSYIIYEDEYVKCFLDVNPLSNGHTLVVPKLHSKDIEDISVDSLSQVSNGVKEVSRILLDKLKPVGIQIVQNNGSIQEVKHFHVHVIPKYNETELETLDKVYNTIKK